MGTSLLSPAGGGSSHGSLCLGVNDRRGGEVGNGRVTFKPQPLLGVFGEQGNLAQL